MSALQWRHNEASQITSLTILYSTLYSGADERNIKAPRPGLCAGNSAEAGELSAQKASNTVNLSIWWRHHVTDTYMRHSASMIPVKLKYRYYMFFKDIALDYIHYKMSAIYFSIRCNVYVLTYFWTYIVPLALCVWWRNAVVVSYQTYQTYILIYLPRTKSGSLILQYFFQGISKPNPHQDMSC